MTTDDHAALALHYLGPVGAMITGSKSTYISRHPGHRVYFNAQLAIDGVVVWLGDLDLDDPKCSQRLSAIASEVGVPVHVMPENPMPAEPTREQILAMQVVGSVRIRPCS